MTAFEVRYRVWWIPGVPATAFHREFGSIDEAKRFLNGLVDYTRYLEGRGLLYDYSADAGGIEVWEIDVSLPDGGEWVEWYDENDEGWDYEEAAV